MQFEDQNTGGPMQGHTTKMFHRITGQSGDLRGQLIADVGCGAGRFVDVARRQGAKVIGLDYSLAADVAAEHFANDPDICICQADALALPLKTECLDGAFSIGVLHHTPNPRKGFEQMVRVVKPGGWIAVSLYQRGGYWDEPGVQRWRRLFKRMWPALGPWPALLYSYVVVHTVRHAKRLPRMKRFVEANFPHQDLPDTRWSVLDTFDSITPSYQSAHEPDEVAGWFEEEGLVDVEPGQWGGATIRGRKPK